MIEENDRKKNLKIWIVLMVITLIIFSPWLYKHYATDTYKIFDIGYLEAAKGSIIDGRIIMGFIGKTAEIVNLPIRLYISILLFLAISVSCYLVILLKNVFPKQKSNILEIISIIVAYVTVFNFMYIENLNFAECFVMSLSLLFYFMAAQKISNQDKTLLPIVLMVLGGISYQGTICFFFVMLTLQELLKDKPDIKTVYLDIVKGVLCTIVTVLVNFLIIKVSQKIFNISQARISSIYNNISIICYNFPNILVNTCGLFPKYHFIVGTILIFLTTTLYSKKQLKYVVSLVAIIIVCVGSAFIPSIVSSSAFFAGRIRFSVGALIGIMYIYLLCRTDIFKTKNIYCIVLCTILALYSITIITNYCFIIKSGIDVNRMDKSYIQNDIENYIEKYEKNTNNEVTKIIGVTNNTEVFTYHEDIKYRNVITWSAIHREWCYSGVINYYTGKKLKSETINYTDYINILNNNNMQDDYIVFIENTMYMKVFN